MVNSWGGKALQLSFLKHSGEIKWLSVEFKQKYEDISDNSLILLDIIYKTINPKVTVERPKAMCAGDPYCEYVWKLEEWRQCK